MASKRELGLPITLILISLGGSAAAVASSSEAATATAFCPQLPRRTTLSCTFCAIQGPWIAQLE